MRLAALRADRGMAIAVVEGDRQGLRVLDPEAGTVDDVVRGLVQVDHLQKLAESVDVTPLAEVHLESPLQRFGRDILCTGWNYLDHFYESVGKRAGQGPDDMPDHPTFFTKGPDTVIGPQDPIAYDPDISSKWDYEAEVALVIGKDGRSIREADALGHVFGLLLANDVSQRDLQRAHGGQWLKGKSIDQTMPLGPWVTTLDEIHDLEALPIGCELNGEQVQDATIGQMAFSIPRIIAELSRGMTLRAGDVVLTGTPSGIGNAREPAIYLAPGDVVVTRGGPLGELRNVVRSVTLTG